MIDDLIQNLRRVEKPTEVYSTADGARVLVLPYGGRVLGLFAPGNDENFFWTHPALAAAGTAREFYASKQWHNSGGDRTWLAPEIDFFFPDFPDLTRYWQPRELDPGNYQARKENGQLELVNRLTLTLSRSKQAVELEITKALGPAPNPLRHEQGLAGLEGVEYAGYTLRTSLRLLSNRAEDSLLVGLWNLLQLPNGGELFIPTCGKTEPNILFGMITSEDLSVQEYLVRYKMGAAGGQKLGLRAVATAGRVGYLYRAGEGFALVIRNFFVNLSGEYVDVPWGNTEDLGYAVQACNINNELGSFSELEYHVPAIGHGTGSSRAEDTSQVWAFRGPLHQIRQVMRSLLSPAV
jgi:hypothetical protein